MTQVRAGGPDTGDHGPTSQESDVEHSVRICEARKNLTGAEEELRAAVLAAREAGDSWTVIGAALGATRQAVQQRFGG